MLPDQENKHFWAQSKNGGGGKDSLDPPLKIVPYAYEVIQYLIFPVVLSGR